MLDSLVLRPSLIQMTYLVCDVMCRSIAYFVPPSLKLVLRNVVSNVPNIRCLYV